MQTLFLLQMGQCIVLWQNIIIKKKHTDFLSQSLVSMIAVLGPFSSTSWIQNMLRVFASVHDVLQFPS